MRDRPDRDSADVVIVGGGVIALASAWRLAQAGADVLVLADGAPAASTVAAGMLAPVSEASYGEQCLLELGLAALQAFPSFAADLEADGACIGLRREGTLNLGLTADDRGELDRLTQFRAGLGLSTRQLDRHAVRQLEPYLGTQVRGAVAADDDLSVDNRALVAAVRDQAMACGVRIVTKPARRLMLHQERAWGVEYGDGEQASADTVILAAGARSAQFDGVPAAVRPRVLPVKGHVLRLAPLPGHPRTPLLRHTVRALVHGHEVYLVPRANGEVVVGATVEHMGFDETVTVVAVRQLLRDASEVLPVVDEMALAEICVGLRPGTPDNGPLLGWSGLPGLFIATGHYRNGILLSGLSADEVSRQVRGQQPSTVWQPFAPNRFDRPL